MVFTINIYGFPVNFPIIQFCEIGGKPNKPSPLLPQLGGINSPPKAYYCLYLFIALGGSFLNIIITAQETTIFPVNSPFPPLTLHFPLNTHTHIYIYNGYLLFRKCYFFIFYVH